MDTLKMNRVYLKSIIIKERGIRNAGRPRSRDKWESVRERKNNDLV